MAIDRQEKFFNFLKERENSSKDFTEIDVVKATGWSKNTFNSYLSKGQLSDFVSRNPDGSFIASNTIPISFTEFSKKLSQSKNRRSLGHNCKSLLAKSLLYKCRDNMMLALENYNRPSLINKTDSFVMLFCCAWEQLLKAILIEENGEKSIYSKPGKSGVKRTISLRECLNEYFEPESPVRKNIEQIANFRDQAVHLLMPELQGITSRIFQSGILNFSHRFEKFTETPFINSSSTGMISLVGDFNIPPASVMKAAYGDIADDILQFSSELKESIAAQNNIEFAIPLNVKLVFAKDGDEGNQVILTKAEDGISGLKNALVMEKTVSPEKSHPYLQKEAILEVNKRLHDKYDENKLLRCLVARDKKTDKPIINPHCFQALVYKLKWKNSNDKYHHHITKPSTHLYSNNAIEILLEKITSNDDYVAKAKKSFSQRKF